MGTASHGVVMDYDISQPGLSIPDEAKRATADLARRASMWVTIAEVNEELLNPTIAIDYDDDAGEELPIQRPPVNIRPNSRLEDFEREVSEAWPSWIKAWERVQDALKTVTYPEIMGPMLAARQAMVELGWIFNPQVSPSPDHRLGHHLSRPGGVLYCRAGGRCRVRRAEIEAIARPLNDFSDLIGTYHTDQSEAFTLDAVWTVNKVCKRIGRSTGTLRKWRMKTVPQVRNRVKGEAFTWAELGLIARQAQIKGDYEAAGILQGMADRIILPLK